MKKALLIGIEYTNSSEYLPGCKHDVLLMKQLLIKRLGFEEENITILTDNHSDRTYIKPTGENIYSALQEMGKNLGEEDLFLVHYSGHGTQLDDLNNDELDGKDEAIVPSDHRKNGIIIDDQINALIKQYLCKTVLFFDCCHSGTITDLPYYWKEKYDAPSTFNLTENLGELDYKNKKIYKLSAALDHQESVSISINRADFVGLFTQTLYRAILQNQDLTTLNLFKAASFINSEVKKHGLLQRVNISSTDMYCETVNFKEVFNLLPVIDEQTTNDNEVTIVKDGESEVEIISVLHNKIAELENTVLLLNNKHSILQEKYDGLLVEYKEYQDKLTTEPKTTCSMQEQLLNEQKRNKELNDKLNKSLALRNDLDIRLKTNISLYRNLANRVVSKNLLSAV